MRSHWLIGLLLIAVTTTAKAQPDTVFFSVSGGFYEEVFALQLTNGNPENHIRYTVNGNRPTAQSCLYEEPLLLDDSKYSGSNIYTIMDCPEQEFFFARFGASLHCHPSSSVR